MDGTSRGDLLERGRELAALAAAAERAAAGDGGIVLVTGEAGIGKTALLLAAAELAADRGLRPLTARGAELEREFSFGVVRQLVEPLARGWSEEERERMLAGATVHARPIALRTSEPLATARPTSPPCTGWPGCSPPSRLNSRSRWWSTTCSGPTRPRCASCSSWPGASTPFPSSSPAGGDPSRPTRWWASSPTTSARVVQPSALSPAAVATLVASRLGAEATDGVAAGLHRASGGNPFYAVALLADLPAEPAALGPRRPSRWCAR